MSVGDILDGAFKLFRANVATILLVTLAVLAPLQFLAAYAQRRVLNVFSLLSDPTALEAMDPASGFGGDPLLTILTSVVSLLVLPFVAGAVSRIVGASYLGEECGVGEALRAAGRRWWSLLSSWFLVHLVEWSVAIVGIALLVVGGVGDNRAAIGLGVALLLIGLIGAIFVMPLFVATAPAIVLEETGAIRGMRRSWQLISTRYWGHLGIALLAGLLAGFVSSAIAFVPTMLSFFLGSAGWVLYGAGAVVSNVVALPIIAIIATLQYFDGRIRREGFDLEVIARDLARARPV